MYLLSLYFQDPAALGFSPLQAGLATLPATVGPRRRRPAGARLAARVRRPAGHRRRVRLTAVGFVVVGFVEPRGSTRAFVLPLIAIAVGMGLSNGPASSAATACGARGPGRRASGVSNMARYVGAAVATALAATIYGTVIGNQTADGASQADALASGCAAASWMMAIFSFLGVLMAFVMAAAPRSEGNHGRRRGRGGRLHPHAADVGDGPTSPAPGGAQRRTPTPEGAMTTTRTPAPAVPWVHRASRSWTGGTGRTRSCAPAQAPVPPTDARSHDSLLPSC